VLTLLVCATRIPFFAKTLFEFDSVNYAIALFKFDLAQDTPQLPGYVLHVGIAKIIFAIVQKFGGDANLAYVLESFFLSLGSVLFVWYAVRIGASRGAAFAAATVWALNPIFWFYGCVASVYAHEAFFTSAVAAIAIKYCTDSGRQRERIFFPVAMAVVIGFAGAARQTSLLFLAPVLIIALWSIRAPLRAWIASLSVVAVITAIWMTILFSLAGGFSKYIELAHSLSIVQYNSIFLHGTLTRHSDMIGKMALYLIIGTSPYWTLGFILLLRHPRETRREIVRGLKTPIGRVLAAMIILPLAFYTFIFYAKPGYLLNISSVAAIGAAILACRLNKDGLLKVVKPWAVTWCIVWVIYFIVPMPGKSIDAMHRENAISTTSYDASNRYPDSRAKIEAGVIKEFSYASSAGIAAFDNENEATLSMLQNLHSPENRQVIIASRWGQWGMFYRPQSIVYDREILPDHPVSLFVGHNMIRKEIPDSVVLLAPYTEDVVLIMWEKHWAFPYIQSQVHLEKLPMPEYLDAWIITDEHFRLTINGTTFVR